MIKDRDAMPRYEQRTWRADPTASGRRTERQAFRYLAYVPDKLCDLALLLRADVAQEISAAERALDSLNRDAPAATMNLEVVARRLLRAESVASSRIEGLVLSQRRLAKAEAEGAGARDETARSVLGNVLAMEHAIRLGSTAKPFTVGDLLELHGILISATSAPESAGKVRTVQNWIGGNAFNPRRADFVPPPPEHVSELLDDLSAFLNRTDLPAVVQAAVGHAQFETIHPFDDGNGRVGRALIHIVLRRRGLASRFVPPVSLVLAADAKEYIAGLTEYREGRVAEWCRRFAEAVREAASKAADLAERIRDLQEGWRERAGRPRRDSSAEALIAALPAYPIMTVATASELLGRSKQAANEALAQLAQAGVVRSTSLMRRNRAWEAVELFDLVNDLERELAMPGDRPRPSGGPRPRRRTRRN